MWLRFGSKQPDCNRDTARPVWESRPYLKHSYVFSKRSVLFWRDGVGSAHYCSCRCPVTLWESWAS